MRTHFKIPKRIWPGREIVTDVTVFAPLAKMALRHRIEFTMVGQRAELVDEAIENAHAKQGEPDLYYRFQNGHPVVNVGTDGATGERPTSAGYEGLSKGRVFKRRALFQDIWRALIHTG